MGTLVGNRHRSDQFEDGIIRKAPVEIDGGFRSDRQLRIQTDSSRNHADRFADLRSFLFGIALLIPKEE